MQHQLSYFSTVVNAGEPTLCQRVMWGGPKTGRRGFILKVAARVV